MVHHPPVHGPSHIARPNIEVPERPHVESIPARSEQSGSSVVVIAQNELSPVQGDVSVSLGVSRLLDDIESELLAWDKLRHLLLDDDAVAEHALPVRSHEVAAVGGLGRIRKTEAKDPIVRTLRYVGKGQDMRPDFIGRGVDKYLVCNYRTFA